MDSFWLLVQLLIADCWLLKMWVAIGLCTLLMLYLIPPLPIFHFSQNSDFVRQTNCQAVRSATLATAEFLCWTCSVVFVWFRGYFVCDINVINDWHRAMMQYPSDAHWSVTRPAVMYVAKMDGSLDVWDFLFRCRLPTLNVMVGRKVAVGRLNLLTLLYSRIHVLLFSAWKAWHTDQLYTDTASSCKRI